MLGNATGCLGYNTDMADFLTKAQRSVRMASIRSRGNKRTEMALVRLFRQHHITGWRRHQRMLASPDFIFRAQRLVIFVDGCFWHGCPKHSLHVLKSGAYWKKKLVANQRRDQLMTRTLRRKDWRVLRIWEHELARKNETRLLKRLQRYLGRSIATDCIHND
jgi:DNA mismatch endonuclease (patch repair protein)